MADRVLNPFNSRQTISAKKLANPITIGTNRGKDGVEQRSFEVRILVLPAPL
jgi:hypothetical protein